ncbi:tRNA U34 5-methylaminomethyl-2-thiouridine-forming methyltransferase MnmC [Rhodobacter aestuarii]|uniref:tRNA U34 5-methylaminomethyl-2-thiouridine-forming methyltransferase MnmC n=1 Tax=Rhodobacter aestuarii TaxID=453582 RepID=A0A1N7KE40_9RHOB|nr:tRNA (5-methylaminomethyl-2-thiouridine)(34)-methyltransferase MnmD [Rhodobacter aestuarii]PTV95737.1 tRNA U34 5-methylaminomethyl-2-thiouridine-forming methyltransferase MnmC [Rhodobacter aestuarii]SIS59858.1 tRNA U34 5-methylaminomethyl-2-thiouridine-forming methyltransferase MnmC [Rhodobacter aestuarii]
MTSSDQSPAALIWRDGSTPVSTRFDDPYFSLAGGLAETRHVFLAGNDLPARFCPGFHVAELGFGTGLNLIATALATELPIRFTTFEAFPMSGDEMARALQAFPEAAPLAAPLVDAMTRGETRFTLGSVSVELILGDVRETLPQWGEEANAWFLDGFSPAKNPEMWGEDLMAAVGRHTAPGGSFATYTAAGFVRRGLSAAGFTVERVPGHAGKRHMSRGQKP